MTVCAKTMTGLWNSAPVEARVQEGPPSTEILNGGETRLSNSIRCLRPTRSSLTPFGTWMSYFKRASLTETQQTTAQKEMRWRVTMKEAAGCGTQSKIGCPLVTLKFQLLQRHCREELRKLEVAMGVYGRGGERATPTLLRVRGLSFKMDNALPFNR